jgi:ABC-type glycerol-3-phosphate transport system permease component
MRNVVITKVSIYALLIIAVLFAIFPIYWALNTSFKHPGKVITYPPNFLPKEPTIQNYSEIIGGYKFHNYIIATLKVVFGTIGFSIIVSIYGAFALSKYHIRRKSLIMIAIISTSMIPGISILLPLYSFAVKMGIYDTFIGLIIVFSAWLVPSEVWFLKTTFDTIPVELEEAAIIDGCSKLGAFHRVILPNSLIGIASVAIFAFVRVWNDFLLAQTLTISEDKRLVSVALYNFLSQFGIQWGQLMAATILSALPVTIFFVALQRFYISGFISGAVKQ